MDEFRQIGALILRVIDALAKAGPPEGDAEIETAVLAEVRRLCDAFPIYGGRA